MALSDLGVAVRINEMPNVAVRFSEDRTHVAYDGEFANRHYRVLIATHRVFAHFRTAFLGKVSPVHFFSGAVSICGHSLFRPGGAASRQQDAWPTGGSRARGLFP